MKFHYGQKVKCIKKPTDVADTELGRSFVGLVGTVLCVNRRGYGDQDDRNDWVGVSFDKEIEAAHSLFDDERGRFVAANGWYCSPDVLAPLFESVNIEEFI